MSDLEQLWNRPIASWWLPVAFILGAAGWALLAVLWSVQAYMAARGTRWPAMYIHLLKVSAALPFSLFFLLSLLWRDPAATVTLGAFSRNLFNGFVVFALFVATVWRIKEAAKKEARAVAIQDVPFLKENV